MSADVIVLEGDATISETNLDRLHDFNGCYFSSYATKTWPDSFLIALLLLNLGLLGQTP